ncbi:SWI/SNF complex 60 kDa subunit [Clavulina sp. PMI_390]|nr:SWI/SNF complex 60 kDa subunit [Clavulina sp. PMI_390]
MSSARQPFSFQRSGRTTDLSLPSNLSCKEDLSLYNGLRDAERKLDWTLSRKVMEVQDSLNKTMTRRRTLRVYVSHTTRNQSWQNSEEETPAVDFDSGKGIPSWELRVEGKLLPGPSDAEDSTSSLPPPPARKFSTFLKSAIIELDRDPRIYPEESIIEWHRNPSLPPEDGFVLRRRGDFTIRVRILLHLDHTPERCQVAASLGDVLGLRQGSRVEVITALYQYIKLHGLQDKIDRRIVKPDDALRRAGLPETFPFQDVPSVVHRFLHPSEPATILHTITVESGASSSTTAYDIEIDMDDREYKSRIRDVLDRLAPTTDTRVARLDHEISETTQAIRASQLKQQFFQGFAHSPQTFISDWMASQSRDLETILGNDRGVPDELMRRSDFFRLPWVDEAVVVHESMRVAGTLPAYQSK